LELDSNFQIHIIELRGCEMLFSKATVFDKGGLKDVTG